MTHRQHLDFLDKDLEELTIPHQDMLVISVPIRKVKVLRVLVDIGVSVDILYWMLLETLTPRRGFKDKLRAYKRVGQTKILVAGMTTLLVALGKGEQATTVQVDFTVVRFTSRYNAILGRTTLYAFQAITSTYHWCFKFPTMAGVCYVKGSQQSTQSCYMMLAYSSKGAIQARKRRVEEMGKVTLKYMFKAEE